MCDPEHPIVAVARAVPGEALGAREHVGVHQRGRRALHQDPDRDPAGAATASAAVASKTAATALAAIGFARSKTAKLLLPLLSAGAVATVAAVASGNLGIDECDVRIHQQQRDRRAATTAGLAASSATTAGAAAATATVRRAGATAAALPGKPMAAVAAGGRRPAPVVQRAQRGRAGAIGSCGAVGTAATVTTILTVLRC